MMRQFKQGEVAKLVEPARGPCVSIYLPFRGKGEPCEERKARLASLVNRTERLLSRHFPEAKDQLLSPFLKLGERVSDLLGSERGVAFFKSKDVEGFALLQDPAQEAAIVAESFHVKPLLSEIQRQRAFYVVSLKAKSVRLYEGSDLGLEEIATFQKRESNIHSMLDRTPRRQKSTMDFLREAEKQIRDSISYDSSPLVLVGPPELQVAFRSVNRFRNAIAAGVDLVAEEHPEVQALFRATWPVINGLKKRREARTLAEYRELASAGRTTDSLGKIALAAAHGQVKTLILEEGCTIHGKLDAKTGRVEIHQHPDDHPTDDVFDDLAELVLNHGGAVSVIAARDMPSASPAVAILRPRRLGLFRSMPRGGSA